MNLSVSLSVVAAAAEPAALGGLRRKTLDQPLAVGLLCVTEAIVHAAGSALPEFDTNGRQHITSPVRRLGDVVRRVSGFELFPFRFERCAIREHRALARGPGSDAAAARASFEVGFRFGFRQF